MHVPCFSFDFYVSATELAHSEMRLNKRSINRSIDEQIDKYNFKQLVGHYSTVFTRRLDLLFYCILITSKIPLWTYLNNQKEISKLETRSRTTKFKKNITQTKEKGRERDKYVPCACIIHLLLLLLFFSPFHTHSSPFLVRLYHSFFFTI